jgi:tyrosyl-tRNA synthetase
MSAEVASTNISKITSQVKALFENVKSYAILRGFKSTPGEIEILNNEAWWEHFKLSDFLTNVARYMRLAPMLARDRLQMDYRTNLKVSSHDCNLPRD